MGNHISVNFARIYLIYPRQKRCHPSIITRSAQLCSRDLLTANELIKVDQKLVSELVQNIISWARNLLCHPNYWSSSFCRLDVLLRMHPRPKESYGLMAYLLGLYSNSVEFSNLENDDNVHLRWIIKSGNFKSETDLCSFFFFFFFFFLFLLIFALQTYIKCLQY